MDKKKKRRGKKRQIHYRGKTLDEINALAYSQQMELYTARIRRRLRRSYGFKYKKFMDKIKKAKDNCVPGEKPQTVKTHLRDAIIMPSMVNGMVSVYNGRDFNPIEIKFYMIGTYLGEYSLTYKPTSHGRPGVGATKGSSHVDKK